MLFQEEISQPKYLPRRALKIMQKAALAIARRTIAEFKRTFPFPHLAFLSGHKFCLLKDTEKYCEVTQVTNHLEEM